MSIKDDMNSSGEYLPTKWTRTTVADGDWLQENTIKPLSSRDNFLADKIGESNSAWKDALSSESATRYSDDQYLSANLTALSSEYETFKSNVEASASTLNTKIDNEITRATNKEGELNSKITQTNTRIDNLEAATDVIAVFGTYEEFTAASASTWQQTVTDNDFIKVIRDDNYQPNTNDPDYNTTDDDVYQVYYEYHKTNHDGWIGWSAIGSLDPYYSVSEIDDYLEQIDDEFDNLSATVADNYLSANENAVSAGKNIQIIYDENKPKITINTKADVEFNNVSSKNVSSTNVTALTANGNSANFTTGNFTNLTSTNATATNVNSTNVTATNVTTTNIQGTQANYTNFSGSYLTGVNGNNTVTATISGLINSAANGGSMTAIKNVSGIKLGWDENKIFQFTTSADLLNLYVSGGAAEWIGFDIDRMNNAITVTGNLSPILKNYLPVNWSGYTDSLFSGTSRSAQNAYSSQFAGSADLANSASIATNTQDKITAYYKEGNTNKTGTFNVSSLALSAGKGINFVSAANQLSISSEGTTYTTGQYINISNDNKISVTGTLINSAQSGQSAYNWITAQSATLSAGPGIKFTSAGQNTMGITITAGGVGGVITAIAGSALSAGANYIGGNYISINQNNNSINLSSNISADNISANLIQIKAEYFSAGLDYNSLSITGNNRSYTASIDLNYTNASYKCAGSAGTAPWSAIINNANSNWVSSNPAGISISSDSVVKLVFTPTLPSTLDDNTYYIV